MPPKPNPIQTESLKAKDDDLYMLARYTVSCCNDFFRILRDSGIWVSGERRWRALQSGLDMCEGFARLATETYDRKWKLFKFRPKYHLVCHIVRSLNQGGAAALNPICSLVKDMIFFVCMACLNFSTVMDETRIHGNV